MSLSEYTRNGIVDSLTRNQPFVVPVLAGSLHDGNPGEANTMNLIDTTEDRDQITSASADNGQSVTTGDPATWTIEEAATITYLGLHDAISSGNALGYQQVDSPVTVADGDKVQLTAFTVNVKVS